MSERERIARLLYETEDQARGALEGTTGVPWDLELAEEQGIYLAMADVILAQLATATARVQALEAHLSDLQWSGGQDRHGCGICPDCYQTSSDGHTLRCELAALLQPEAPR